MAQMTNRGLSLPFARFAPEEQALFSVGLLLALMVGVVLGGLWWIDQALVGKAVAVMAAVIVGGRIPAVLTGLEVGLGSGAIIALLSLFNSCWLLLAFPLFSSFHRRAVELQLLGGLFGAVEDRAREQQRLLAAFGIWALSIFVWLPFPLTGGFVGAVIGLLLGVPVLRLIALVLLSMWAGIATWTLGFEYLYLIEGQGGRIACWVITAAILIWSLAARVRRTA